MHSCSRPCFKMYLSMGLLNIALSQSAGAQDEFHGEQIWYENMLTGSLLGRTLTEKNLRKNESRRGEHREDLNYSSIAEEKSSSACVSMEHLKCTMALQSCVRLWQCQLVHVQGVNLVRPMPPCFLKRVNSGPHFEYINIHKCVSTCPHTLFKGEGVREAIQIYVLTGDTKKEKTIYKRGFQT